MGKYKNKKIKKNKRKKKKSDWFSYEQHESLRSIQKNNPWGMGIANWCGPGTKFNNQKPLGKADNVCRIHDYSYQLIKIFYDKGSINNEQAAELTRLADDVMLKSLETIKENTMSNKVVHYASFYGIKLKKFLENRGFLNPIKFSTAD